MRPRSCRRRFGSALATRREPTPPPGASSTARRTAVATAWCTSPCLTRASPTASPRPASRGRSVARTGTSPSSSVATIFAGRATDPRHGDRCAGRRALPGRRAVEVRRPSCVYRRPHRPSALARSPRQASDDELAAPRSHLRASATKRSPRRHSDARPAPAVTGADGSRPIGARRGSRARWSSDGAPSRGNRCGGLTGRLPPSACPPATSGSDGPAARLDSPRRRADEQARNSTIVFEVRAEARGGRGELPSRG